jgi:hypothetical protein
MGAADADGAGPAVDGADVLAAFVAIVVVALVLAAL